MRLLKFEVEQEPGLPIVLTDISCSGQVVMVMRCAEVEVWSL